MLAACRGQRICLRVELEHRAASALRAVLQRARGPLERVRVDREEFGARVNLTLSVPASMKNLDTTHPGTPVPAATLAGEGCVLAELRGLITEVSTGQAACVILPAGAATGMGMDSTGSGESYSFDA